MSYIKIEIGGKERGLKFNQLALDIILDKSSPKITTQNIYAMFFGGLTANSFVKGEEVDFTLEDVSEWVDELYMTKKTDTIKQVEAVLVSTQLYKSMLPKENPEPGSEAEAPEDPADPAKKKE